MTSEECNAEVKRIVDLRMMDPLLAELSDDGRARFRLYITELVASHFLLMALRGITYEGGFEIRYGSEAME